MGGIWYEKEDRCFINSIVLSKKKMSTNTNNNNTDTAADTTTNNNNNSGKFVNAFLDLHNLLSEESSHSSSSTNNNDWKYDFEKSIYNDLRALDASMLFTNLLNFLKDDDKIDIKKEIDNPSTNYGNIDIDTLFELCDDNYDVKTLIVGKMLQYESHRNALAREINRGNKHAALFATIVNVMYRFLNLSKIIWMQFWGVTKIEDIFDHRLLSREENEERIEARKKAIEKINNIVQQQKPKVDKINTIFVKETTPPIKTIIVDKLYPYLLTLKRL